MRSVFPNNGWLVEAASARRVGYADIGETFGTGSDCRFAAAFAEAHPHGLACLVDGDTAVYRLSRKSIARSNRSTSTIFAMRHVFRHASLLDSPRVRHWVRAKMPVAIQKAGRHGMPGMALRWWFSRWHASRIPSLGGLRRGLWILISLCLAGSGIRRIGAGRLPAEVGKTTEAG